MPDKDGKLSPDEMDAITAHFEAFEADAGHDLKCEVCGNIVWSLNGHLMTLLSDSPSGALGAKVRVPMIQWFCSNCGNTKLFAAQLWGVESFIPEGVEAPPGERKLKPFKITSRDQLGKSKDESDGD